MSQKGWLTNRCYFTSKWIGPFSTCFSKREILAFAWRKLQDDSFAQYKRGERPPTFER